MKSSNQQKTLKFSRNIKKRGCASIFFIFTFLTLGMTPVHAFPLSSKGSVQIFANLAEQVVPSVVNISTTSRPKYPDRSYENFFEQFRPFFQGMQRGMPFPRKQPRYQSQSSLPGGAHALGSGVIVDVQKKGNVFESLILTNHHVIDNADTIRIQFSPEVGEKSVAGKVVGKDKEMDLALIRVSTKTKLKALPLGSSKNLRVGEWVMAVGNPFGQGHSVSKGIISAKGRSTPMILGRYLQTDAPINPGNSGGPLVNLDGKIVGINNAILARAQGIGFAIPSSEIQKILPQLKENGNVTRGYIGIQMREISDEAASFVGKRITPGLPYVAHLEPNGPAAKAGIQEKDIIVAVNGNKVTSPQDLLLEVTSVPVGETAKIRVLRAGRSKTIRVRVDRRPIS